MDDREGSAWVGLAVVALPAEFDAANAWRAGEEFDSVFVSGITVVIADLTATIWCDSSGVAVLARAHGKAVANNAELRLVVPSAAVRRVLALAGLDRVLRIFPGLDEALAAPPLAAPPLAAPPVAAAPVPEQAADVDSPDDLSALFRSHREPGSYPRARDAAERLTEIDQIYERWVTAFSEYSGFSPVLLVPDPGRAAPGVFRLFATGSALLRFARGLNGLSSGWPEGLGPGISSPGISSPGRSSPGGLGSRGLRREHADLISAFFRILQDWIAAPGSQDSGQAEADVSRVLDEHMKRLAKGGFVVVGRERFLLLTGGIDAEPLPWRIVDIKVQPAISVRIAGSAGNGSGPPGLPSIHRSRAVSPHQAGLVSSLACGRANEDSRSFSRWGRPLRTWSKVACKRNLTSSNRRAWHQIRTAAPGIKLRPRGAAGW